MIFNLKTIEEAFKAFQTAFPAVNDQLEMRRETFTDTIISNLMESYSFLNHLWKKEIDLFSVSGLHHMLELNHIVLCGHDPKVRAEFYRHLQQTRDQFYERIRPIHRWYQNRGKTMETYEIAAEYYGRALSFPQLFIEGNHLAENVKVNYFLLHHGLPPYIISADTAVEYLDVSARIKFSTKKGGERKRVKHSKKFRLFLEDQGHRRFLTEVA